MHNARSQMCDCLAGRMSEGDGTRHLGKGVAGSDLAELQAELDAFPEHELPPSGRFAPHDRSDARRLRFTSTVYAASTRIAAVKARTAWLAERSACSRGSRIAISRRSVLPTDAGNRGSADSARAARTTPGSASGRDPRSSSPRSIVAAAMTTTGHGQKTAERDRRRHPCGGSLHSVAPVVAERLGRMASLRTRWITLPSCVGMFCR